VPFVLRKSAQLAIPPRSLCEVCLSAMRLASANDTFIQVDNAGLATDADRERVALAIKDWEFSKDGRHTGAEHEPVVP
jgi:hypothetical protein